MRIVERPGALACAVILEREIEMVIYSDGYLVRRPVELVAMKFGADICYTFLT